MFKKQKDTIDNMKLRLTLLRHQMQIDALEIDKKRLHHNQIDSLEGRVNHLEDEIESIKSLLSETKQ